MERVTSWSYLLGGIAERRRVFFSALLAGQIAGLAFLAIWCLGTLAFFRETSGIWPLRVMASFLMGDGALTAPPGLVIVLGLVVNQFIPSLLWSLLFGWVVVGPLVRTSLARSLVLGGLVGFLAVAAGVQLILPPIAGVLFDENLWWSSLPRWWDWVAHLCFGVTMGWFFEVLRPRLAPTPRDFRSVAARG